MIVIIKDFVKTGNAYAYPDFEEFHVKKKAALILALTTGFAKKTVFANAIKASRDKTAQFLIAPKIVLIMEFAKIINAYANEDLPEQIVTSSSALIIVIITEFAGKARATVI